MMNAKEKIDSSRLKEKFPSLTPLQTARDNAARTYKLANQEHFISKTIKGDRQQGLGHLELWPAHSSCRDSSFPYGKLTTKKRLVLLRDEDRGRPNLTPKPQLLELIDKYLESEIRTLNVQDVKPNELRFELYRRAFDMLIEYFPSYGILFSSIKTEYEMMLNRQRQQINKLLPLQGKLVALSEKHEEEAENHVFIETEEIIHLKENIRRRRGQIDKIKKEKEVLQKEVERLQGVLGIEYEKCRDECDARKLLVQEIAGVRFLPDNLPVNYGKKFPGQPSILRFSS